MSDDQDFSRWKKHVDERLDRQDAMLNNINNKMGPIGAYFDASRAGAAIIKWLAAVGAAAAAVWGVWHSR